MGIYKRELIEEMEKIYSTIKLEEDIDIEGMYEEWVYRKLIEEESYTYDVCIPDMYQRFYGFSLDND